MKVYAGVAALVVLAVSPGSGTAQYHTDRGAVLGGLTGALVGAGIGEHNDQAGPGALIGAGVGLLTGAAIGNSMDQEEAARARAYQQQQVWQMSRAASVSDVVTMSRNGVADSVIINHIAHNGIQRRLEVADVISMHQQGVSQAVIAAMQQAPVGGPLPPPTYHRPVIVEEHYYVAPPVHCWHGYPHYRPHYHHHPGVHWSIAVGR